MTKMRIIFIGSVYFSFKMLESLIKMNANVVGVVSKRQSNFNADFYDLNPFCKQFNLPNLITNDINSKKVIQWIDELHPEVIYCFGWSNIIKKQLLRLPKRGVVGFHPTLLPLNRGRHPLIWAKVLGLKESGTTFFIMDEGADSGPIISQKSFLINENDTAHTLYQKIIKNSLKQIKTITFELENNSEKRILQEKESNYWRKRNKADGRIHFSMTSDAIINLVRALTKPYPGATCFFNEKEVIVWSIRKGNNKQPYLEPGKVIKVNQNEIEVKTGDGSVILIEHEFTDMPVINQYLM
jgi:methionyl-tRNA formyltransferase